jgi:hypothetical protein
MDGKSSHCLWQGELKTQDSKIKNNTSSSPDQKCTIKFKTIYVGEAYISIL